MMRLLLRQDAGGQVRIKKTVAGHGSNLEKFLRPLKEGVPFGMSVFITKFSKTLEGVFLSRIQLFRDLHLNTDMKIASAATRYDRNPLPPNAKDFIGGGPSRNLELHLPV